MAETQKLPVWDTARASFVFLFANRSYFYRAAAVPFVGLFSVSLLAFVMPFEWLTTLVEETGYVIFGTMFALKWHRFYLLRRDIDQPSINTQFDEHFSRFLFYMIGLTALPYVLVAVFFAIPGIVATLVPGDPSSARLTEEGIEFFEISILGIAYIVLWSRQTLIFPSVAVDASAGVLEDIRSAWRYSSGNGLNIAFSSVGAILLVGVPFMIIVAISIEVIVALAGELSDSATEIVYIVFASPFGIIAEGLAVTIISIAFDRLTNWRDERLVESEA